MIKRFFQNLEDPDYPLLGPNIRILRRIGLLMPRNKFVRFAYLIIHELATFFVVSQFMELYEIKSDLDLVITNLRISMLSLVCVVKSNTSVYWQKNWVELINYVTEADTYERNDTNSKRSEIIDSYTKYCRKITYLYCVLVFSTFVTVTTTPLFRYLTENFLDIDKSGQEKEMFYHIFSSWMPFDKYHWPGNWVTVIWHTAICAYGATIVAAYDVSAMVIMVFFGGKLELLRERCTLMLGVDGSELTEEQATDMFRKMHRTHILLLRYSKMFNAMLSPVMFLYVVMCSLMLCASAFQLTSATNMTQKLLMAEYLIFGISQLFMFCWHSNDVLFKSENVYLGPYESDWWRASVKQRRAISLLLGQMKKPILFTAGPFTDLTLATFIAILKGAYSYYTLLRK